MVPISKQNNPVGGSGESSATSSNRSAMSMSQETADNPRFLVIKKLDGSDFARVSPFLIHKSVYGLIGEAKSVKKISEGLLIETSSSAQSRRLLKVDRIAEFPVVVNPHGSLNSSRGVIYCRDFLNCSVAEIEENLKDRGVINVKRIQVKREGVFTDTPNLILTFNTLTLLKFINAAMYRLEDLLFQILGDVSDANSLVIRLQGAAKKKFVFVANPNMRVHRVKLLSVLTVMETTSLKIRDVLSIRKKRLFRG